MSDNEVIVGNLRRESSNMQKRTVTTPEPPVTRASAATNGQSGGQEPVTTPCRHSSDPQPVAAVPGLAQKTPKPSSGSKLKGGDGRAADGKSIGRTFLSKGFVIPSPSRYATYAASILLAASFFALFWDKFNHNIQSRQRLPAWAVENYPTRTHRPYESPIQGESRVLESKSTQEAHLQGNFSVPKRLEAAVVVCKRQLSSCTDRVARCMGEKGRIHVSRSEGAHSHEREKDLQSESEAERHIGQGPGRSMSGRGTEEGAGLLNVATAGECRHPETVKCLTLLSTCGRLSNALRALWPQASSEPVANFSSAPAERQPPSFVAKEKPVQQTREAEAAAPVYVEFDAASELQEGTAEPPSEGSYTSAWFSAIGAEVLPSIKGLNCSLVTRSSSRRTCVCPAILTGTSKSSVCRWYDLRGALARGLQRDATAIQRQGGLLAVEEDQDSGMEGTRGTGSEREAIAGEEGARSSSQGEEMDMEEEEGRRVTKSAVDGEASGKAPWRASVGQASSPFVPSLYLSDLVLSRALLEGVLQDAPPGTSISDLRVRAAETHYPRHPRPGAEGTPGDSPSVALLGRGMDPVWRALLRAGKPLKALRASPLFPSRDAARSRTFSTCAVVGDSALLLGMPGAKAIDSHEAVFRVGAGAPTLNWQRFVGSKTTVRVVGADEQEAVREGRRETVLVAAEYDAGVEAFLEHRRRNTTKKSERHYLLAPGFVTYARAQAEAAVGGREKGPALNAQGRGAGAQRVSTFSQEQQQQQQAVWTASGFMRGAPPQTSPSASPAAAVSATTVVGPPGGGRPVSAGWLAVLLALHMCHQVSVFGWPPAPPVQLEGGSGNKLQLPTIYSSRCLQRRKGRSSSSSSEDLGEERLKLLRLADAGLVTLGTPCSQECLPSLPTCGPCVAAHLRVPLMAEAFAQWHQIPSRPSSCVNGELAAMHLPDWMETGIPSDVATL